MPANTKHFTLNSAIYQDISEGYQKCSFRLRFQSPKDNALRIVLAPSLPALDTLDFDRFDPPDERGRDQPVHYKELLLGARVYARADRANGQFDLTVYRA